MAVRKDEGAAKGGQPEGDVAKPQSRLSMVIGWVIVPGLAALGLFALGAYVGVHHPELWLTRLTRWFTG